VPARHKRPKERREVDICELIETYIEQDPWELGRDRARVKEYGVSVAAIITALLYAGGDLYVVAEEYELPEDAVRAAVYYYALNKQVVDARLLLNWAIDDPVTDPCAPQM
jgi:hypothetical protein